MKTEREICSLILENWDSLWGKNMGDKLCNANVRGMINSEELTSVIYDLNIETKEDLEKYLSIK